MQPFGWTLHGTIAILTRVDIPPWNGAFGLVRKKKISKAAGSLRVAFLCRFPSEICAGHALREPRNASNPIA